MICILGMKRKIKKEVKEILNVNSKVESSVVIFPLKNIKEYAKLAYLGQSFTLFLQLIDSFEFKDFVDFVKKARKIKFRYYKGRDGFIWSEWHEII